MHGSQYLSQAIGLGDITEKATGGKAGPMFVAGDPGPYEEMVYAPGGAYVFTAAQTRAMKGRGRYPHFAGGALPGMLGGMFPGKPMPMEDQAIWYSSSRTPFASSAQLPTGEVYTDYGFTDSRGSYATTRSTPAPTQTPTSSAASSAVVEAASAVSTVSEAASTIAQSGAETADATKQNTAMSSRQNESQLQELRGIRQDLNRILIVIPKAINDSYQKVVGS
jgi:hypothetical protein